VREEALEAKFTELLGRLDFDDEVLAWVREALHVSHADQRREHDQAIERLQAEHRRLGDRISAMYIDKLDGKIGGDFYDRMADEWREEQSRAIRQHNRLRAHSGQKHRTEAIVMSLARGKAEPHGQSVGVNDGVDFAGQAASRVAHVLLTIIPEGSKN
jgi:site-specific DNA recombinase